MSYLNHGSPQFQSSSQRQRTRGTSDIDGAFEFYILGNYSDIKKSSALRGGLNILPKYQSE